MDGLPVEIERDARTLFWDVDLSTIDPQRHAAFIIGRVLSNGTLSQVRAVERHFGRDRIRRFFLDEGGIRQVDPQTGALWCVLLGLTRDECISRSSPIRRNSFWNG